jgi:membrane-bound serine protease (ClpP class)
MEILSNPNIAYILLVVGFVLTLMAIVAPGTGLLEVGAFFLMALAGYAIYQIGFINVWALIVLALALVPFVYATRKPKREWALALSILAIILGSLYLFQSNGIVPSVNPLLAIVVSFLTAGFIWLAVSKTMQAAQLAPTNDLGRLIGRTGEAKTRVEEEGSVQVAGELWSARSEKPIPAGSRVRVLSREGFMLVVTLDDQFKK